MIRRIKSTEDIAQAVELLELFMEETAYQHCYPSYNNQEHLGRLVHQIVWTHYAWLATDADNQAQGLLLAIREPNIWFPGLYQLRELVWYVRPEYRTTITAGRLFRAYCDQAESMIRSGEIQGYFTTRMATSPSIDLDRRGFRLMEHVYLKEQ